MAHLAVYGNAYWRSTARTARSPSSGCSTPTACGPSSRTAQLRFRYTPRTGPQQMLTERRRRPRQGPVASTASSASRAVSQATRVLGLSDELVKHALAYFDTGAAGGTGRPAGVLRLGQGASDRATRSARRRWLQGGARGRTASW